MAFPLWCDAPIYGQPKPIQEEEESPAQGQVAKSRIGLVEGSINLAEQAKNEKDANLKRVLEEFVTPYDLVSLRQGQTLRVALLRNRFDPNRSLSVEVLPGQRAKEGRRSLDPEEIASVSYYEERALQRVRELLQKVPVPGVGVELNEAQRRTLQVCYMVLADVLRRHREAIQKKERQGTEWQKVEVNLRAALADVQVRYLRDLIGTRQYEAARVYADRVYRESGASRAVQESLDYLYVSLARNALDSGNLRSAREYIEILQKTYTRELSADARGIFKSLEDQARALLESARRLAAEKKYGSALRELFRAEDAYPILPGLREFRSSLQKQYPLLRIGIRQLPQQMSPVTALSDIEGAAARLLFDYVIEPVAPPGAEEGYASHLLLYPPRLSGDSWELVLVPDLKWSDGSPVTPADVTRSFELITDPRSPLYQPTLAELVQLRVSGEHRLLFQFTRAVADPASVLMFPLLPARHFPPQNHPRNLVFGSQPVGSGPYLFAGQDGQEWVFQANPHYRRPHASQPAIVEIRLVPYRDFIEARDDLTAGRILMLFDVTAREAETFTTSSVKVVTPTRPREARRPYFANPRIYFLALNHTKPALRTEEFRRALGLAINRDELLRAYFRGKDQSVHQPLTGPFPVGSWASDDNLEWPRTLLHNPAQSRQLLDKVRAHMGALPRLTILCPDDDHAGARACRRIAEDWTKLGVQSEVQLLPRQQLAAELAKPKPDYDVAYWSYVFDNEALSLWPLLDPRGLGEAGRNYLGYTGDGELEGILQNIHTRREFAYVQRECFKLHELFAQKMVFIPLWQLDRFVAFHPSLRYTRLHPLYVFHEPEVWRIQENP